MRPQRSAFPIHAMPIVVSATVQTTARQPLLMASGPTATIAMAGSQYSMKTRHRLERMSHDSQVVASDFILRTPANFKGSLHPGGGARVKRNCGRVTGDPSIIRVR